MMIRLWAEMCREISSPARGRQRVWRETFPLCSASRLPHHKTFSHFDSSRALLSRRKEQNKKKLHDDVSLHSLCRHLRHNVHLSFADFTYFCWVCFFLFPVWRLHSIARVVFLLRKKNFSAREVFCVWFGILEVWARGRCGAGVDWSFEYDSRRADWMILEIRLLWEISKYFVNFDVQLQRNSSRFLKLLTSLPHLSHSRENKLK